MVHLVNCVMYGVTSWKYFCVFILVVPGNTRIHSWTYCILYWATVCKTVHHCLSVLSCPVCDVGVLWPNGWMHQDETWHAGRPWPWPHYVRWGVGTQLPSPKRGRSPQFSAHVCCGQMAGWIKMPLGREVGLSRSDTVIDRDPALPAKGEQQRPSFRPMSIVATVAYLSYCWALVALKGVFHCAENRVRCPFQSRFQSRKSIPQKYTVRNFSCR